MIEHEPTAQYHFIICVNTVLSTPRICELVFEAELDPDPVEVCVPKATVFGQITLSYGGSTVLGQTSLTEMLCQSLDVTGIPATKELVIATLLRTLRGEGFDGGGQWHCGCPLSLGCRRGKGKRIAGPWVGAGILSRRRTW